LDHKLKASNLLPQSVLDLIENVLGAMRGVMDGIGEWKNEPEIGYETPISVGDADSLIKCVKQASQLHDIRAEYAFRKLTDQQFIEKVLRLRF
jgi:hypothetical protein